MRLIGMITTAALSLIIAAPVYAQQEQRDQQEEQKAKPARDEKKAQPEKSTGQRDQNAQREEQNARQQDKNKGQEEKSAQQQDKNNKQEERNAQQQQTNNQHENRNAQQHSQAEPAQQAQHGKGGRIPDDRYRANFGQQHRFRVNQADYRNHRFQYGGYSFGFVDVWPSNWLYTEDVYVIEIDGIYYLCNPMYPGVNIALSFTL